MLKQGIIDETGYMPGKGFSLTGGISISAGDIRQFQLAKSAILSGIKILCKNAKLHVTEIKNVYIAGGLGFFINKQNAAVAGLIPVEFLDSISVSGNLSLRGAEECLMTTGFSDSCRKIISLCSVIDLAGDPSFAEEFTANMFFE